MDGKQRNARASEYLGLEKEVLLTRRIGELIQTRFKALQSHVAHVTTGGNAILTLRWVKQRKTWVAGRAADGIVPTPSAWSLAFPFLSSGRSDFSLNTAAGKGTDR